jgi:hypothetical protein
MRAISVILGSFLALAGCRGCENAGFAPDVEDPRLRLDSGVHLADAEPMHDAAEAPLDAFVAELDAFVAADAELAPFDAAGLDAAVLDAWSIDSAVGPDAATLDAGSPDALVRPDASAPDAGGPGTGDLWIEIDYSGANTPESPSWSFSNTPGFGPAQWAMTGASFPQAWDRFNNMQVVSDPIGTTLAIGPGSQLQLMIGLTTLISYRDAVVHLEGRSLSTDAPVSFDVTNPLNSCGDVGSMSQDWIVHQVDVDLMQCMVLGGGVQAIRVDPQDGTVALVRMRLTLFGASW